MRLYLASFTKLTRLPGPWMWGMWSHLLPKWGLRSSFNLIFQQRRAELRDGTDPLVLKVAPPQQLHVLLQSWLTTLFN